MTTVENATCRNCGREIDVRPCPFCGGNVMDFNRGIIEPQVEVSDTVTRTVKGVREKKNRWVILAILIISGFAGSNNMQFDIQTANDKSATARRLSH